MENSEIEILKRALEREKKARKEAEKILEEKSRNLFILSRELKLTNNKLQTLLEEKSNQLQGVFENINDAYVVIDLSGKILKMNDVAEVLFEYNLDEYDLYVNDLVFEEDAEYAFTSFQKLLKDGSFNKLTARIKTKSNTIKWVQINGSVICNEDSKPIAAQGIVRDITEERAADQRLLESENRLSSLILNLDSGVLLEDENRKIKLTNKMFCELFHISVSPSKLIGQDCTNAANESKHLFLNPDAFVLRINELLENKKLVRGDELMMLDGTILERDFIPIIQNNTYKGHLWTYKEITLKKQYSQSLEIQRQKYSNIIANMNLGLVEVDNDDQILMINQSFSNMSGYTEDELIGKRGTDIFLDKEDVKIIQSESNKRVKGKSNSYELRVKNKKGEIRHWLISGAPNYNLKGEVIGSIGIHLDITEFKALEKQKEKILKELEQSNNELQEYAHIVSHDLKSPLRSIDALINWIKVDNQDTFDELTLKNFQLIEETLVSMDSLISNILEYSSAGNNLDNNDTIHLNDLVLELKKVLFIPDHIEIIIKKQLPVFKGDKTKLKQLFQNLISNAVKFIDKEKGFIYIDYSKKGGYYQFTIEDNGIGIEKKYHDKIFKIFQTLNKSKESTGVGLSIVKKIVNLYHGDIWIESEPKKGTKFIFTLQHKK